MGNFVMAVDEAHSLLGQGATIRQCTAPGPVWKTGPDQVAALMLVVLKTAELDGLGIKGFHIAVPEFPKLNTENAWNLSGSCSSIGQWQSLNE